MALLKQSVEGGGEEAGATAKTPPRRRRPRRARAKKPAHRAAKPADGSAPRSAEERPDAMGLEEYKTKRDFGATPEPAGKVKKAKGQLLRHPEARRHAACTTTSAWRWTAC